GSRPGGGSALDGDRLDDDRVDRLVHRAGGGGADGVHDLTAGLVGDLAEDRVLAVEPRGGVEGDEELRAVGARAGVGHGEQVGLVEDELGVDLVLERVARATGAGAQRATALDHEALDHPVEAQAVVVLLAAAAGVVGVGLGPLGETDEVVDRLGSVVGEQVDDDVAAVGLERGLDVRHGRCLSMGSLVFGSILPRRTHTASSTRTGLAVGLASMVRWGHTLYRRLRMRFRRKQTLMDRAHDYVEHVAETVIPQLESALEQTKEKAGPALSDARERAKPLIAEGKVKAAEGRTIAAEKAAIGAAIAAEKAS